jgi:hypothetical protein
MKPYAAPSRDEINTVEDRVGNECIALAMLAGAEFRLEFNHDSQDTFWHVFEGEERLTTGGWFSQKRAAIAYLMGRDIPLPEKVTT